MVIHVLRDRRGQRHIGYAPAHDRTTAYLKTQNLLHQRLSQWFFKKYESSPNEPGLFVESRKGPEHHDWSRLCFEKHRSAETYAVCAQNLEIESEKSEKEDAQSHETDEHEFLTPQKARPRRRLGCLFESPQQLLWVVKKRKAWTQFVADRSLRTRTHDFHEPFVLKSAKSRLPCVAKLLLHTREMDEREEQKNVSMRALPIFFIPPCWSSNHHFETQSIPYVEFRGTGGRRRP